MLSEELSEEVLEVAVGDNVREGFEVGGVGELVRRKKGGTEDEIGVVGEEGMGEADVAVFGGEVLTFQKGVVAEDMAEEVEVAAGFANIVEIAECGDFFGVEVGVGVMVDGSGDFAGAITYAIAVSDPALIDWVSFGSFKEAVNAGDCGFHLLNYTTVREICYNGGVPL